MKRALITGAGGQDGPYLSVILKNNRYEVIEVDREQLDITKPNQVKEAMFKFKPDEVYNLAALSSVGRSFEMPQETFAINGQAVEYLLEAIRKFQDTTGKTVKFFQAGSSEMFGSSPPPQNETTSFNPRSPYAEAKVFAHNAVVTYRRAHNLFAVNGILFNHESPRRPEAFVTRKITSSVAHIKLGLQKKLIVGNIEIKRDWGYAPEYMEAVYLMLQQPTPEDFVIGTGVVHSLRDFIKAAFDAVGIGDYESCIEIDPKLYRSSEVRITVADLRKIKEKLGWQARTSFEELVRIMVEADMKTLK